MLETRVENLERQHAELKTGLASVAQEQAWLRETLDQRFAALAKGQDLVVAKVETLTAQVATAMGEARNTPVGRELSKAIDVLRDEHEVRIAGLERRFDAHHTRFAALQGTADQLAGGLAFARQSGVAALLIAVAAAGLALLKLFRLVP